MCPKKQINSNFGIWLLPYKSLGLKLYTSLGKLKQIFYLIMNRPIPLELSSWTRGRGANPTKGKLGIPGSRTKLEFPGYIKTKSLNLTSMLKRYKKYFGLIISILYASSPSSLLLCSHKPLNQKIYPRTLLWILLRRLKIKSNSSLNIQLNVYNSGIINNKWTSAPNKYENLYPLWMGNITP